jgi:simple sugar transport system substrate-binding protein
LTLVFVCAVWLAPGPLYAWGTAETHADTLSVLVYITGQVAGSPTYELLARGAENFAKTHDKVRVKVYEAGFNQAEWEEQLTSLVAGGGYDLVLGSNPSLPEICANVGKKFPAMKFIITDASYQGNPQISTYMYNQYEQSVYLGYLAGLITTSALGKAGKRIGFIAAQEYPMLSRQMVPGFIAGAKMVDPGISLDFRVIGNWFDAGKAAELAASMIASGVDVFTAVAGGAAQGLIKTAKEQGAYIVLYNTNSYQAAPGIIVGCGFMQQEKLVGEILSDVLAGKVRYGSSRTVGVKEGYLDFIADDPLYTKYLSADIRTKFNAFMADFRAGRVSIQTPAF